MMGQVVREANWMGDSGVERIGVKGIERVGVEGVERVDDDEGDDKGDGDEGDETDGDELESDDEGQYGRGRIRRALCEDTVYARAEGGTAGKARTRRGGVTFCTVLLLLSILAGNLVPATLLGRAPRG